MGVFDDKKFEGLDWISQATEPIDSQANEVLGRMPALIDIDFKMYKNMIKDGYGIDLSVEGALRYAMRLHAPGISISGHQFNALIDCFKLEFDTPLLDHGELILDFEKEEIIGGKITLFKLVSTMDESVLKGMLGQEGLESFSYTNFGHDSLPRANEVMEILGKCELGLKTRSDRKKRQALILRLREIFKTNEWNIRDTELANKVGFWIRDYILEGNMAAFSNFCRLKVMTHKGQPIYSMEEIV